MSDSEGQARIKAATDVFEKDEGTWDIEMEIRPGPGAAPLAQKGVARNRRMAGGRWLIVEHSMETGFEGHGVYGWDPGLGKYVGTWVDSQQSTIARSTGEWDEATATMTFVTETAHQGRPLRYRETTQTRLDGTRLYRNLVPTPDGGEHEMIRAVHRRRAAVTQR